MNTHTLKFDLDALGLPEEGVPDPEKIIAGAPRTRTWNLEETPDGKVYSGVWEATPGKWRVDYDEWEFFSLLSGVSVVAEDGGATTTLKAGDTMILRPGFKGTWEVVETTRKLYVIRLG